MLLVASDIVTNLFFSPVNVVLPNNVRIHKNVQGSRIRLVLGCVISPLRQHPTQPRTNLIWEPCRVAI